MSLLDILRLFQWFNQMLLLEHYSPYVLLQILWLFKLFKYSSSLIFQSLTWFMILCLFLYLISLSYKLVIYFLRFLAIQTQLLFNVYHKLSKIILSYHHMPHLPYPQSWSQPLGFITSPLTLLMIYGKARALNMLIT